MPIPSFNLFRGSVDKKNTEYHQPYPLENKTMLHNVVKMPCRIMTTTGKQQRALNDKLVSQITLPN